MQGYYHFQNPLRLRGFARDLLNSGFTQRREGAKKKRVTSIIWLKADR
jgi:hypothetical protein